MISSVLPYFFFRSPNYYEKYKEFANSKSKIETFLMLQKKYKSTRLNINTSIVHIGFKKNIYGNV